MLSSILSKSSCATCKFCCSFRRQSLWETPLFPPEVVEKLSKPNEYGVVGEFRDGQIVLGGYKTANPEEEVPCTFLDPERGCILKPEDKPFDCSIWPLRIMNKDGELVIALTPTCPSIGAVPSQALVNLVQDGLGDKIFEYAKTHPEIIKEYRVGFPII
jgi:Fe-S-cluster containining protein